MRTIYILPILFAIICFNPCWATEAPRYQLLLQVSEDSMDKLSLALNNAKNAQTAFGPENIEIEIVVFGAGIQTLKYYTPSPLREKIKQATYSGVRIVICENAMRSAKLRPSDMLEEVKYVPSGVAEIIEKHTLGWTYVKP